MEPAPPSDDDAVVDLVDVLLRDGAVLDADVVVTVAEIPLIGIKLRAAIAGMTTMTEYGLFEDWDERIREEQRQREARFDSER
ncbi:Gas vesicle protein [Halogeometricum pallidum JCM 14848]|uniref:Gas vesicle protein n=1 Tax=Halogeometricum pallidum JCM 14848 TaxID=1227487 RepID=M0CY12_HALPD|nr:gas vesicle protein [Halogeometricum pallidum]ELZ26784.1 Gas vesicle protein [Halogeometricum pallidum JCM 14848]